MQNISLFDARPFFEKALIYGIQNGLLDQARLQQIRSDAPKGMVQIARYFGTEHLRPELEKAKERILNLISLHLFSAAAGDLHQAAIILRDNSLLSRSKAGSDLLKALVGMPQNTHFSMADGRGFQDEQMHVLERWTLRPQPGLLSEYQAEFAKRAEVAYTIDAALWFAQQRGLDADTLYEEGPDAEAVVRTGLLMGMTRRTDLPDWVTFEKMITALRKKWLTTPGQQPKLATPAGLPTEFHKVVDAARASILADWPKIMDTRITVQKLFKNTPAFIARYFWLEDSLAEVDDYERTVSATWAKVSGGHEDEGSLITLFLCVAAGSAPKTLLSESAATSLIKKIRKTGMNIPLAVAYIQSHAPAHNQNDYLRMWDNFVEEAASTLQSDFNYTLNDALALLKRECNIGTP